MAIFALNHFVLWWLSVKKSYLSLNMNTFTQASYKLNTDIPLTETDSVPLRVWLLKAVLEPVQVTVWVPPVVGFMLRVHDVLPPEHADDRWEAGGWSVLKNMLKVYRSVPKYETLPNMFENAWTFSNALLSLSLKKLVTADTFNRLTRDGLIEEQSVFFRDVEDWGEGWLTFKSRRGFSEKVTQ